MRGMRRDSSYLDIILAPCHRQRFGQGQQGTLAGTVWHLQEEHAFKGESVAIYLFTQGLPLQRCCWEPGTAEHILLVLYVHT